MPQHKLRVYARRLRLLTVCVGALLASVALIGCNKAALSPARDDASATQNDTGHAQAGGAMATNPEDVVRASIKREIDALSRQRVPVEGWTFFKVSLKGDHDGGPYYMVVKDDGTIIKEDRERELASVLTQLLAKGESAERMASAAMMLLQPDSCRLSSAARIEQMKRFTDDERLVPPAYDAPQGTLTFWTETLGRSSDHTHYKITGVGSDTLNVARETTQLKRATR